MKTKLFFILICNLLICNLTITQNITNTLGALGVFKIKDASTDFLTLTQSTGQVNILKTLQLEYTTSSTTGVIYKGAERFLHNYGTESTFLGINSGNFTMTGVGFNTAVGGFSLNVNTTGYWNSAFGNYSLRSNSTGYQNSAFGYASLYLNTFGINNSAFGNSSLYINTTGSYNSAFGSYSLYNNTTGSYNTALGLNSLYTNTTGGNNIAVGLASLYHNTTGYWNTAVGSYSLNSNTTGYSNTALGLNTGDSVTTGSNNTLIGYDAQPTSGSVNNQITLGNIYVSSLRCNVTTITSLSDSRDKKNIKDLNLGINFLMKLKPRLFNWDKREWYDNNISDGSKMKETPTAGFIAQELDEVQTTQNAEWLNLVLKDNPEKWEATPGNLLPIIVKAIQELKAENDEIRVESEKLNVESAELKSENEEMKQRLLKLEQTQNILVGELEKLKAKETVNSSDLSESTR